MAWFSRSVSDFLQGRDEQHEEWDEMEAAESEEEQDEEQARVSTGKGVKGDLSELTKTFTRQLWGVASFLAPPPPASTSDEDASLGKESFHPVDEQEGVSALELEPVALTPGKSSKAQEDSDSSAWSAGILHSSIPGGKKSNMEQQIGGVRSDLAELKGGFAKGLSHLSSVIRVVAGEDLLLPASVKTETSSHHIQTTDKLSTVSSFNSLFRPLLANIRLDKITTPPEASTTRKDDSEEDLSTQPVDLASSTRDKPKIAFPSKLVSHIDEFSKLASSLLPFDSDSEKENPEDNLQAAGVTDEVVAFADSIAMHPETWLDFPLFSEEEDADDFEMNSLQQLHVQAIEYASRRLAALKIELCPHYMREGRFWKIYFVLLHSRLKKENSLLLSTPQVLEVRNLLLQELQRRETRTSAITSVSEEEDGVKNDDSSYSDVQLENSLNQKDYGVESSDDCSVQKEDLSQLGALQNAKDGVKVDATSSIAVQVGSNSTSKDYDVRSSEETPMKREDQMVALNENMSEMQVNDLQEEDLKNEKGMGSKSDPVQRNTLLNEKQALTMKPESSDALRFPSLADDDEAEADEWLDEEHSSPDTTLGTMGVVGSNEDEDISFSDLEDEDDKSVTCTMPKVKAARTSRVKEPQVRVQLNKNLNQEELKKSQNAFLAGKADSASGHMAESSATSVPEKAESNDWLTVDEEDIASTGSS